VKTAPVAPMAQEFVSKSENKECGFGQFKKVLRSVGNFFDMIGNIVKVIRQ
jgi:hypothetical protein